MKPNRAGKMEKEIQRILSGCLIKEEWVPPLAAISRVEASPDLALAKVYVTAISEEEAMSLAQRLEAQAGRWRAFLAASLKARTVPKLQFLADTSLFGAERVLLLLQDKPRP